MYQVIIFTHDGRDIHHFLSEAELDDFILKAIWASDFHHMNIYTL